MLILLAAGCGPKTLRLNTPHIASDNSYAYIRVEDGSVLVLDKAHGKGLEYVKKLAGCPCILEPLGTAYRLIPAAPRK